MDPEPEEYRLALRARDGDPQALAELIERVRLRLFAWAYADLRHYDDAQDVVAAAILQICRHVGTLREPGRALPWMRRIVRNEIRQHLRRRSPSTAGIDLLTHDLETDPGPWLLRLDILRALRQLPRDEARAVALFYLGSLPVAEIARRTGRPEGTIKRWLYLGRRHLAAELEEYAPMARPLTAVILCSDPTFVQRLEEPVRQAGFGTVIHIDRIRSGSRPDPDTGTVIPLDRTGSGSSIEFHLPDPIRGAQLVILDEWIGGRSAFESHAILKAAVEAKGVLFGLFAASPADSTVFAAWAAGFDLFLDSDTLDTAELTRLLQSCLGRRLRAEET